MYAIPAFPYNQENILENKTFRNIVHREVIYNSKQADFAILNNALRSMSDFQTKETKLRQWQSLNNSFEIYIEGTTILGMRNKLF